MVPFFFTPVLIYILAPARIVVEMVSSALSRTIITGRLALIANRPQIGSLGAPEVMPLPLPPKPPPKPAEITRTLLRERPSVFAVSWRTGKGAWALAQTVRRPLGSICAAAMRGSRYCGWIILVS